MFPFLLLKCAEKSRLLVRRGDAGWRYRFSAACESNLAVPYYTQQVKLQDEFLLWISLTPSKHGASIMHPPSFVFHIRLSARSSHDILPPIRPSGVNPIEGSSDAVEAIFLGSA